MLLTCMSFQITNKGLLLSTKLSRASKHEQIPKSFANLSRPRVYLSRRHAKASQINIYLGLPLGVLFVEFGIEHGFQSKRRFWNET